MAERVPGMISTSDEYFPPVGTGRAPGSLPSAHPQYTQPHHHHQPQGQGQGQGHQKVVLIEAPKQRTPFSDRYYEMTCIVGLAEMVVGLLSVSLGIANPVTCGYYGVLGFGVWCGVLYVICGFVAIQMRRKKTTFLVITHLTLSNIAAMMAGVQFCLGVISATYDNTAIMLTGVCRYSVVFELPNQPVYDPRGRVTVDALLATAAAVLAVAAILASGYTCKGLCCPPRVTGLATSGVSAGGVQCVPGHLMCSGHEGHFSAGTRAIINGVITFQGQDQGITTQQWMLHHAPNYGQKMQSAAAASGSRSRNPDEGQVRF